MKAAAQEYGGSLTKLSAQLSEQGLAVGENLASHIYGEALMAGLLKGQSKAISNMPVQLLKKQEDAILARIENFTVTTASAVGSISPSRSMPDLSDLY